MLMLKKIKTIGPAAMVAAAFIGPGTVTTATLSGAQYGYTLLWAITFSIIATVVLQEMSARLGIIAKLGLGEAIRKKTTHNILKIPAAILVVSAILIGNAAYEAGNVSGAVLGVSPYINISLGGVNLMVLGIGLVAFLLLFTANYKQIEGFLIVMVSLMGVVFLIAAVAIQPNWIEVIQHIFQPQIPEGSLIMAVGLIGTTIVPYNLFLHASAVKKRWSGAEYLTLSRWDTLLSVLLGGLITMAILITASVAFSGSNSSVGSIKDLALQLVPVLGDSASLFISIGFLFAGLSSAITAPLAAAFATSEIMNWGDQMTSVRFRMVWMFVLGIGVLFSSLGFKPIAVILFAQVANGLLLPIIAIFLLWIMNDKQIMGRYTNSVGVNIAAVLVILVTISLGLKSILSAFGVF